VSGVEAVRHNLIALVECVGIPINLIPLKSINYIITYFLVIPKFISFSSKKKAGHGAILNDPVHVLLPCACKGREEEDFKSPFPTQLLLLYLPTCLTTYTTHTLINGETGDPCPPP
jgi:hypothetical protein